MAEHVLSRRERRRDRNRPTAVVRDELTLRPVPCGKVARDETLFVDLELKVPERQVVSGSVGNTARERMNAPTRARTCRRPCSRRCSSPCTPSRVRSSAARCCDASNTIIGQFRTQASEREYVLPVRDDFRPGGDGRLHLARSEVRAGGVARHVRHGRVRDRVVRVPLALDRALSDGRVVRFEPVAGNVRRVSRTALVGRPEGARTLGRSRRRCCS